MKQAAANQQIFQVALLKIYLLLSNERDFRSKPTRDTQQKAVILVSSDLVLFLK